MILNLTDKESIELTAKLGPDGLVLAYDGVPLSDYDHIIMNELVLVSAAALTVADLMHDGILRRMYAWEIIGEGAWRPWPRSSGGITSGPRTELNADVVFIAAPEGVEPQPTSAQGPPPAGTSQTVLKVKVRKQGA